MAAEQVLAKLNPWLGAATGVYSLGSALGWWGGDSGGGEIQQTEAAGLAESIAVKNMRALNPLQMEGVLEMYRMAGAPQGLRNEVLMNWGKDPAQPWIQSGSPKSGVPGLTVDEKRGVSPSGGASYWPGGVNPYPGVTPTPGGVRPGIAPGQGELESTVQYTGPPAEPWGDFGKSSYAQSYVMEGYQQASASINNAAQSLANRLMTQGYTQQQANKVAAEWASTKKQDFKLNMMKDIPQVQFGMLQSLASGQPLQTDVSKPAYYEPDTSSQDLTNMYTDLARLGLQLGGRNTRQTGAAGSIGGSGLGLNPAYANYFSNQPRPF